MGSLDGKKILVAGVSGGIGMAVACRLHAAGARVLGSFRKMKPELEPLKDKMRLHISPARPS